ncbi:MAG TPA: hypothetical protein ENO13_01310 [Candidatus Bathyarchaeota archaeon]|nr:hypothetical protein [Candidatus Bathyarchaeota archaeon]
MSKDNEKNGDTAKKGLLYLLIGLTPVTILSIVAFGTSDPKEGGKSALKGLVQAFINAGPLGLAAFIFILATFILGYLAWKSKQEQIQFMDSVIEAGKEEVRENQNFTNTQTKAYLELAETIKESNTKLHELVKALSAAEKKLTKRVDAIALSDPHVNTSKYLAQRGED